MSVFTLSCIAGSYFALKNKSFATGNYFMSLKKTGWKIIFSQHPAVCSMPALPQLVSRSFSPIAPSGTLDTLAKQLFNPLTFVKSV